MKKKMSKLWEKKNSKKGFTLVELIVVLVILAILAAIMVPSLSGWINKARNKQIVLDARNYEMAVQSELYEDYASGKTIPTEEQTLKSTDDIGKRIIETAGGGSITNLTIKWTSNSDGTITEFKYYDSTLKKTAVYKEVETGKGMVWTITTP